MREYGTRYLRITVRFHGGDHFTWLRSPGPAHSGTQRTVGPAVRALLRTAVGPAALGEPGPAGQPPPRGARPVLGHPVHTPPGGLVYEVPGIASVARLLPAGDPVAHRLAVQALTYAGRTLHQLHQVPWTPAERPPHHGVQRLRSWLAGEDLPADGQRLHTVVRDRLGPQLWNRLAEWAADAAEPERPRLLHGAPSTGWLVPSPTGEGSVLLTGEEITGGDPALDLGWLLGELHELRSAARRGLGSAGRGPEVDYPEAARALLRGYAEGGGDAPPTEGVARAATLRLAIHMRDFACFVGWHEDLTAYTELLVETLDGEGRAAVEW